MNMLSVIAANLLRKKTRTLFTLLSVAAAFLLFGLLSAAKQAVTGGVDLAGIDRLFTMHKVSIIQPLPLSYFNRIRSLDGVAGVSHGSLFDAYYQEPVNYVSAFAVDAESYLDMYSEILLPEAQKTSFLNNPAGVVIGKTLAERFGWKIGDRIPLISPTWRKKDGDNTWYFTVEGIYDNSQQAGDTSTLLMHYDYFNEGRVLNRNTVMWYFTKVADPENAASVAKEIDTLFSNSPAETKTSTEKALVQSLLSQFGDIGAIVVGISSAVFFSMLLVIWNTMAQSIDERVNEISVLRVIGFTKTGILRMIVAESLIIVGIGGALGLGLSIIVNTGIAAALVQYLPGYALPNKDILVGGILILMFGVITGLLPGLSGVQLKVADSLRKVN